MVQIVDTAFQRFSSANPLHAEQPYRRILSGKNPKEPILSDILDSYFPVRQKRNYPPEDRLIKPEVREEIWREGLALLAKWKKKRPEMLHLCREFFMGEMDCSAKDYFHRYQDGPKKDYLNLLAILSIFSSRNEKGISDDSGLNFLLEGLKEKQGRVTSLALGADLFYQMAETRWKYTK